jgi:putative tributyrin esterase
LSDSKETAFRTVELSDSVFEREGLRFATVKSSALGRRADCCIWAPRLSPGEDIETLLILLHGVYGSAWSWALKTGVHHTAQRMIERGEIRPLAIAMPSDSLQGDGSGYLTYPTLDVERWIVEEVPALARLAVPALHRDARVAIAGLSMGGYGALRLGAKYADSFHAISAHSSITRIEEMTSFVEEPIETFISDVPLDELNVLHWLMKNREMLPPVRFDCGIADPLIQGNRTLHHALVAAEIPHLYEEFVGGHEWSYWAEHVAATLRFVAPPKSAG